MPARIILFLLAVFPFQALAGDQAAMTAYIVDQAFEFVRQKIPEKNLPDTLVPVSSPCRHGVTGDTLFVPQDIWGFKTTNNYSLHFYTVLCVAFKAFFPQKGSSREFFISAARASDYALMYVNTFEKDRMINDLHMYFYMYKPYMAACGDVLIDRDYAVDSLQYCCMLKSALAYRCDSTRINDWLYNRQYVDYGITRVVQKPREWKKYETRISLKNYGSIAVPFELLLDFDGGTESFTVKPFQKDTTITLVLKKSLLKVILDPHKRLFDICEENQQYVSSEFRGKQKVYKAFVILLWDSLSAVVAFGLMLFLGIFIHSLTTLFYKNNTVWTGIYICIYTGMKIALPYMLYGFNMWGFVYLMHEIYYSGRMVPVVLSSTGIFALVYYLFKKDGVRFNKLETSIKYIALSVFLCPIAEWLWI